MKERERILREPYVQAVDKIESMIHIDAEVNLLTSANKSLKQELETVSEGKNGNMKRLSKAID